MKQLDTHSINIIASWLYPQCAILTAFACLMSPLSWLFSINLVIDFIHMTHPVLSRKHDYSCFFSIESYHKGYKNDIHLTNDLALLY